MSGVVKIPVIVEDSSLPLHLTKQRRAGIRRQDVERGALETRLFDERSKAYKAIWAIMIEAHHEAAIHLNAVVVEDANAPRVVVGSRSLLSTVCEVVHL